MFPPIGSILNWLFPAVCAACGREGAWLCPNEMQELLDTPPPTHEPIPGLDQVVVAYAYDQAHLAAFIQKLKYNFWTASASTIDGLFRGRAEIIQDVRADCLVPVPLHPARMRYRGFNQSQLIAQSLSQLTNLPIRPLLRRTRNTAAQARQAPERRRTNVRDAFASVGRPPKRIILVDDVITTGATLAACASTLRAAGAEQIIGLALARG